MAYFAEKNVTLNDIESYVNNELGFPTHVFVFRHCNKKLSDIHVVELPARVTVDVSLLGGGKFEYKECDLCKRRIPKTPV